MTLSRSSESICFMNRWSTLRSLLAERLLFRSQGIRSTPASPSGKHSEAELRSLLERSRALLEPLADNEEERDYIRNGLDTRACAAREAAGLRNVEQASLTRSEREIIRANLFTLFNILNFVLAGIVLFASLLNLSNLKNLTFLGVVLCNLAIGIFQEIKAKRIVDRLSLLVAAQSLVLREGELREISPFELVVDDLLLLQNGEQVPVDGIYLAGEGFELDESLLTGESDSVEKKPGDEVCSGTTVVSGFALLRVNKVGAETVAANLSKVARSEKKKRSELKQSLFRIIKAVSILIVPLGLALFLSQYFRGDSSLDFTLVSCVAALVGMIPEGLILLTEIAFAVGTTNLSQQRCLVQNMSAIEMLARMDTLCLDKTGTITDGSMRVLALHPLAPSGSRVVDGTTEQSEAEAPLSLLTYAEFCASSELRALPEDQGEEKRRYLEGILADLLRNTHSRGATQEALLRFFTKTTGRRCEKIINFSSARKWSGIRFEKEGSWLLGAAEFILPREDYLKVQDQTERFGARGRRVLLLARSTEAFPSGEQLRPADLVPLALIEIEDHIREDAAHTFRYFEEQGVDLKIISGDHPKTLSAIARRASFRRAEDVIDMSRITEHDDLGALVEKYSLFARSNPYQKQALLHALQKKGHIVGMTGDGVNDVPALKEADCSVAMVSGSDAARGSADLVLLNDNLSALIRAVYEGRRVINNIERVASLFLIKTLYSSLLSFIYIFISSPYPLIPIQMAVVSSLTIGIPSFFLALKPNRERVSGRFLDKVLYFSLPPGLTAVLSLLLVQALSLPLSLDSRENGSICLVLLLTVGFTALYKVSRPLTLPRLGLLLSLFFTSFFLFFAFPNALSVADIFSPLLLLLFLFSSFAIGLYLCLERIYLHPKLDRFRQKLAQLSEPAPKSAKTEKRLHALLRLFRRRR